MSKVVLRNVSKYYTKDTDVISNINVEIQEGEFFVLVGPSGCGKSTMLRMIAGLEEITGGELLIDGEVVNHLPPVKRNLSMVFQNYALYPHLTVAQNIAFGLDVKKIKKTDQQQKVQEVAAMLGLEDYLKRKPRELSGGQRQRVALARAIVSNQPICLMDEPLSNLDAKLRTHMRSEIRRIQRQFNITMIYVTHDQIEAMTMGDRIMILHNGEIQQIGRPIDIYNKPANPFVATFIGTPPMNLGEAVVQEGTLFIEGMWQVPFHTADLPSNVVIGIRPERLQRATATSTHVLEVVVTNVEILGTETIFMFQFGEKEWTVKWTGQWHIEIGQTIRLTCHPDDVSVFSGMDGSLIREAQNIELLSLGLGETN